MEFLPDDILQFIFFFLSTKDKINILKTSLSFRRNIQPISILIPKINKLMERIQCIDMKPSIEMMLIIDNLYVPYRTLHLSTFNGVNPLYCRNRMENTCIVDRCREKKIGDIFLRCLCVEAWGVRGHCYIKRKMPYCLKCFKIWYLK